MTVWTNAEEVKEVAKAAFPDYNGKKFKVKEFPASGMDLTSYWSGGSRDYYAFVDLNTKKVAPVPQNGSGHGDGNAKVTSLPDNIVVVEHSYFCGKDFGCTVYVGKENLTKMLPAATEISLDEKIVLVATRSYKSSYAGETECRFKNAQRETKISRERWDAAKEQCIAKKLLNKAGAITNEGRNAVDGIYNLYTLVE